MNNEKTKELSESSEFTNPKELPLFIRDVLDFINNDSETLSLLYDLDLLPEQLDEKSHDWYRMIVIADFLKKKKKTK